MGYIISPDNVKTADSNVLAINLNFDASAVFTTQRSAHIAATNLLKNLLLTKYGEHYGNPTYGTRLIEVLFDPSGDNIKETISEIITQPVNYWLSEYINLHKIEVLTNIDNPELVNLIQINISFSTNITDDVVVIEFSEDGKLNIT